MNSDQFHELQKQHLNLNKFLFLYKEKELHTHAFFGKLNLRVGSLIVSTLNLLFANGVIINCIERYSFLFFIGNFIPNITLMIGSVYLLLSIEQIDAKKSNIGYIISAIAFILQVLFISLSMIFSFIYSPSLFFRELIWNIIILSISFTIHLYFLWVDYCYAKNIAEGRKELVEFGFGPKVQGPVIEEGTNTNQERMIVN